MSYRLNIVAQFTSHSDFFSLQKYKQDQFIHTFLFLCDSMFEEHILLLIKTQPTGGKTTSEALHY